MRTTKLLNDPKMCVSDAIEGICLTNSRISRIQGLNVLVRKDINSIKDDQVTLISGGGSGHEPAHAGYIGQGMLSGAVLGNVFASPPVNAILAAIRVCAGAKGVLLIIKNYTGDRLNFGMALERARAEGIEIEMVVVDDDCALPEGKGITGARGVAGTIFVHKIAGAEASRSGSTLGSVKVAAQSVIDNVVSYGMSMGLCAVPGSNPVNRLASSDTIEVGIGIHGEAGQIRKIDDTCITLSTSTVRHVLNKMLGTSCDKHVEEEGGHISPRLVVKPREEVAVLLNNLGGISELELLVLIRDVMLELKSRNIAVVRCFIGSFMTSLEMAGFSLSLLKMNPTVNSSFYYALDFDTNVNIWRKSPILGEDLSCQTIEYEPDKKSSQPTGGGSCESICIPVLARVCEVLKENSDLLNEYDAVCGDGDCGRVVLSAATHILNQIDCGVFAQAVDRASFCYQVAEAVSEAMGGTSGAIVEIMFRAMVSYFTLDENATPCWAQAFEHGVSAVRTYGGADVGMRTLLDALVPAIEALTTHGTSDSQVAEAAFTAAKVGMEQTMHMESLAGRANYVSHDLLKGTPDPGAYAVYLAFKAGYSLF